MKSYFQHFSKPDIFQSDNGTEFKNPLIKGYCEKKNIKFINGRVRHPQSQGVVEKINDFVAKSLKSSFEAYLNKEKLEIGLADEKEWWGIETALLMFVANQNSKVHTVTNFPPNELVNYRDINNNEHLKIINQVKEKIYSYYTPKAPKEADTCKRKVKSKNKRLPNLKIGMKVFMIGEIKKDEKNMAIVENTLIKKTKIETNLNKKKIPVIITDVSNLMNNLIKVKVVGKPQNDSICVDEIYTIHLKNIEITNADSWKANLEE